MRTVHVEWLPGEERFTARGTHPGHEIGLNAPRPATAPGPPTGFSPTELLLAAAGSCSAWDVVEITRKARMDVTGVDVAVTGHQSPEPPWPYERIELHYTVRGHALRRPAIERAIRLACDRYCSVLATVRGVAQTSWELTLVDEDGAGSAASTEPAPAAAKG